MPVKPNIVVKALREARTAILQIVLLNSFIDALVMFMLLLLACTLLTLPNWYALVGALVYAVVHTHGNLKDVSFAKIEEKVPELSEQLITVADNVKMQNDIIDALNAEVLEKMKSIRTSYFLDFGRLTREVAVMAVISFIIIGSAAFNVEFLDLKSAVQELKDFRPHGPYDINEELLEFEESTNLSEILGEKSITELGQQQLDLQINPINSDVVIGTVNDPESKNFRDVPPREIRAAADVSFEDEIPKQYQRIVKTYFKEITRT